MNSKHLQNCQEVVALARKKDIGAARFQLQLLSNRSREYYSWKPEIAAWRWAEGEVLLAAGESAAAQASLRAALEILSGRKEEGHTNLLADIYRALARAAMQSQNWGEAAECFEKTILYSKAVYGEESWQGVWSLYPAWAGAMFLSGDGKARGTLEEGLRNCKAIWGSGSKEWRQYIEKSVAMLQRAGQQQEAERYQSMLQNAPEGSETDVILGDLDKMVGLWEAKQHLHNLVNIAALSDMRKEQDLPPIPLSIHLALLGPPGTGKSTVALLAARLYKALGLLPTANIVTATGGELSSFKTAAKVHDLCDRSQGGVLLLQEAYSIPERQRAEAVAALLDRMEEERDRFALIVTGYPEPMQNFLGSNPGLQSRFETILTFPPYTKEELLIIFELIAREYGISLEDGARQKVLLAEGEGGARSMRNLFQASLALQAARLGKTPGDLRVFLEEDIAL